MKKIIIILVFLSISLFAHPLEWITQEFKDFRTYPRIDKAYKLIEKENYKEARELLEKALDIDAKNLKALRPLVSICLMQEDYFCIKNKMNNSTALNDSYFQFIQAQMYIHQDLYEDALSMSSASLRKHNLNQDDRRVAKLIYIEAALHLKRYDDAQKMGKSLRKIESKEKIAVYQLYLIQLGFNINQLNVSGYLIQKYLEEGNTPTPNTLLSWSVGFDEHKQYYDALKYTLKMPESLARYKREVTLYERNMDYKSAAVSMEKVYKAEKTNTNQLKLVYLYESSRETEKLKKYYLALLDKGCNEKSVTYLLGLENEKENWLKKLYPYECLKQEDKFEYQLAYFQTIMTQNKKANAKANANEILENIKPINAKQYIQVATLYQQMQNYEKSIYYSNKSINNGSFAVQNYNNLGFSYEKLDKLGLATFYYEKSYKATSDVGTSNTLSYLYAASNQPNLALEYLQKDKSRINSFDYHYLKYKIAINEENKNEQLLELRQMLKYLKDEKHYAQFAILLDTHQNDRKSAIVNMEKALEFDMNNTLYLRQLSYWYESYDLNQSIKYLTQIIRQEPKNPNNYEQMANLYLIKNEKSKATQSFKLAVDNSTDEKKKYNLKKSVLFLEKQFDGNFSYGTRLDKYGTNNQPVSLLENSTYGGFMSFELAYRPKKLENKLAFYGRVLGSVKDRTLSIDSSTVQYSLGVRTKLYEEKNIYLSFEKLFKNKENSRDDEMIRLSGSFLDAYEYSKFKNSGLYNSIYTDAAYFFNNNAISLYGNYESGYIFPLKDKISFMPYLTAGGLYNNDNNENDSTTRLDVGFGLSLLSWHNETKYKADSIINRLKLEFRKKYAGNIQDDKTVKLQLEVLF